MAKSRTEDPQKSGFRKHTGLKKDMVPNICRIFGRQALILLKNGYFLNRGNTLINLGTEG